jgi:hypothetical protein
VQGFYYLMSLVGIWFIAHWFITNDGLDADQPTVGLFQMKDVDEQAPIGGGGSDPKGKLRGSHFESAG